MTGVMSIKSRIDRLTQAAGRDKRADSTPPYDVAVLRTLSPEELLRLHRCALADDADVPDPRMVEELRRLPLAELIEHHRATLEYVGTAG
jgi:hypothetical protein